MDLALVETNPANYHSDREHASMFEDQRELRQFMEYNFSAISAASSASFYNFQSISLGAYSSCIVLPTRV